MTFQSNVLFPATEAQKTYQKKNTDTFTLPERTNNRTIAQKANYAKFINFQQFETEVSARKEVKIQVVKKRASAQVPNLQTP